MISVAPQDRAATGRVAAAYLFEKHGDAKKYNQLSSQQQKTPPPPDGEDQHGGSDLYRIAAASRPTKCTRGGVYESCARRPPADQLFAAAARPRDLSTALRFALLRSSVQDPPPKRSIGLRKAWRKTVGTK